MQTFVSSIVVMTFISGNPESETAAYLWLLLFCTLQYGSHSKKRPNNLTIGRTYDHHIYDLVELGVENFKPLESFSYDKKIAPKEGSKPFITFIGEGFENVEELKHLKEVLLDLLRGEVNLLPLDECHCISMEF